MAEQTGASPSTSSFIGPAGLPLAVRTCRRVAARSSEICVACDWQEPNFWPECSHPEFQFLCAFKSALWEVSEPDAKGTGPTWTGGENQILILPPGTAHSMAWRRRAGMVVIHASHIWAQCGVASLPLVPALDSFSAYTLCDPLIGGLLLDLEVLCKSAEPHSSAQLLAHGAFLAARILQAKATVLSRRSKGSVILGPESKARVCDFIEAHLAEQITMPALAHEARLSVSHFTKVFKTTTGLTPEQYILRSRLWRARRLIESGTRTIGEIAYVTGFADHSHPTVQFNRMFGAPPKAFRPVVRQL
ncbi:MAG: AraC family transcriptional regulator [Opitutaceae bacterium]|nr:AraC family transcriptional regulator [Opitutaceae bacterium]